ncbi:hypothetical protein T484DRAFT_1752845 [Baffinella frigidus]|nr:hypothetical protein T484DRAFT_1752845 [Cryptophyta sp. CCMP2293]
MSGGPAVAAPPPLPSKSRNLLKRFSQPAIEKAKPPWQGLSYRLSGVERCAQPWLNLRSTQPNPLSRRWPYQSPFDVKRIAQPARGCTGLLLGLSDAAHRPAGFNASLNPSSTPFSASLNQTGVELHPIERIAELPPIERIAQRGSALRRGTPVLRWSGPEESKGGFRLTAVEQC